MKTIYKGDTRYEKVYEQMQLLGIQEVTTKKQKKKIMLQWKEIKNKQNIEIQKKKNIIYQIEKKKEHKRRNSLLSFTKKRREE